MKHRSRTRRRKPRANELSPWRRVGAFSHWLGDQCKPAAQLVLASFSIALAGIGQDAKTTRPQSKVPAEITRESSKPKRVIPKLGELNTTILEVCREYRSDGTHAYFWPRGKEAKKYRGWAGNTRDLRYAGKLLFKGDEKGRAFCCGLTFEVFFEAWRRWCKVNGREFKIAGLDAKGVRKLKTQWFGSAKDKTCLRTALVDNGLGVRIEKLQDAKPGDFVQLWRANGSGHSVIFLSWVKDKDKMVGLRYWSTQKSTRGIGERIERFDRPKKRRLLRDQFYLCRVGRPVTARTTKARRGPSGK